MQPVDVVSSDPLTGWATVALTAVAVATLVYSVITTRADRRNADMRIKEQQDHDDQRAQRDRAEADARLAAERKAADQRLADERAYTEKMRQRERQQDSAARLLVRLADLLPLMNRVPNVYRITTAVPLTEDLAALECGRAVEGLRFAGVADLPGLGDAQTAEQFHTLVHLVLTVARNEHHQDDVSDQPARRTHNELVVHDLWRYATFVRLSLEHLIEQGDGLDPGWVEAGAGVAYPLLHRRPGDNSLWSPSKVPQGWQEAISRDPNDPQYRAAK